mmetsp:Transcript_63449/g.112820  ORF Transcript_63449/g.112820 Transcript_63449/m.112820 type:complete len:522 (+) Transcript_63449:106-1671(+)|eukprot:CAMPEP_0197629708 /NCGR_PEP_ID=MMETSP1338-20131121/7453_1 /TAXON_ID=43686 ORGANISM="Pelagodinium beii, Strain RCC1491" /NCGR_SAMPLE_ID=MMETSP1338 /ASSEMBLY_ACC=CAM_ASM_000754 /LENGTH=521 /DNA_ID=CAMNT_0043200791 /DNA_START=102 /DNA_END=1667 /DNA_ORIENTATION=+
MSSKSLSLLARDKLERKLELLRHQKINLKQAKQIFQSLGLQEEYLDLVLEGFKFDASELIDYVFDWAWGSHPGKKQDDPTMNTASKVLRDVFYACDADFSGTADKSELAEMLRRYLALAQQWGLPHILEEVNEETVQDFFAEANVDGDDSLSIDEFISHAMLTFQSAVRANRSERRRPSVKNAFSASKAMTGTLDDAVEVAIDDWYMNYWELTGQEQFSLLTQTLSNWSCDSSSGMAIDVTKLKSFFVQVRESYLDNAYHNFQHALSTLHLAFKLVQGSAVTEKLTKQARCALAIGALCHDIGHRGFNNAFEVVSQSDLALRYNDKSPLENHHCARAFEIAIRGPEESRIFHGWKPEKFSSVRKHMVGAILATDMAFHSDKVKKLSTLAELPDDEFFLTELLLHAADIGHTISPLENNLRWGAAVQAEFSAQVSAERSLGVPVSSFMEGMDDPVKAAKSQIGFFDFVITPMFAPLFSLCPDLEQAKKNLAENRAEQVRIAESGAKPAKDSSNISKKSGLSV